MPMRKYPPRGSDLYDSSLEIQRPIFGVDIDGTLGLYHEHFTRFASAYVGRSLPSAESYRGGSFATHLGLSKSTYRKIKLAYRRGGLKRSMPVFDGASDLTASLRKRGAIVVLCTTRPYLSLENIDEDTRHWAQRNRVQHDYIIWGENKYRDLSRFGSRVVGVLEDEPALVKQAVDCGLRTAMRLRQYNEHVEIEGATPAYFGQVRDILHGWLDEWEKENR